MYVHACVVVHQVNVLPVTTEKKTSSPLACMYMYVCAVHMVVYTCRSMHIRESVDSLCRDDTDMPMTPYIRKAYNRPNAALVSLFR